MATSLTSAFIRAKVAVTVMPNPLFGTSGRSPGYESTGTFRPIRQLYGSSASRILMRRNSKRCFGSQDGLNRERLIRKKTVCSGMRSEEHTSELQSLAYLVCRLLLE